ncbi:hypothetical protein CALCODRAFT_488763 [Calocera cornea HHB12733]|uniref:Uncharacterized protein n=1 Tax=Calocera cornea HHB12733 TaxID=1353952 RepID=A0A165C7G8_9BASI|nr:hypothetical protein CALCODRAFT_488763 [Calocera cornea HHB12733]
MAPRIHSPSTSSDAPPSSVDNSSFRTSSTSPLGAAFTTPSTSPWDGDRPANTGPCSRPFKRANPCDDEDHYQRAKKSRADADPMERLGKHMARTLDLFEAINPTLHAGLANEESDCAVVESEDPQRYRRVRLYHALRDLSNELEPRLGEEGPDTLDAVARLIEKGRGEARTEDTSKLKGTIYDILKRIFGHDRLKDLDRRRKAGRGFHNDLTGRLLTPSEMNWANDEDRRRLKEGEAGDATSALNFPSFMFGPAYKATAGHRFSEFMMNDLLLRVALAIFIAPSAATADDILRSRSNRKGNAELHNMSEMTAPSLAYLALQVRFALSAEETFSKGGQDTFDYSRFYYSVIELLENPLMKTRTAKILRWYNARMFPLRKVNPVSSTPVGTAALMLKELEELGANVSESSEDER